MGPEDDRVNLRASQCVKRVANEARSKSVAILRPDEEKDRTASVQLAISHVPKHSQSLDLMLTAARNVPSGNTIHADVCIIGAGPAGISMANEFLGPVCACASSRAVVVG